MIRKNIIKRSVAMMLAATMVLGSGISVRAASVGETFENEYASEQTKDVIDKAQESAELTEAVSEAAAAAKEANENARKAADEANKLANAAADAIGQKAPETGTQESTSKLADTVDEVTKVVDDANQKLDEAASSSQNIEKDASDIAADKEQTAAGKTNAGEAVAEAKAALDEALNAEGQTEEEKYEIAKAAAEKAEKAAAEAEKAEEEAKAAYEDAQKKLEDAETELQRMKEAKTAEEEAQKELEKAQSQFDAAKAGLDQAKQTYQEALKVQEVTDQAAEEAQKAADGAKTADEKSKLVQDRLAEVNNNEKSYQELQDDAAKASAALDSARAEQETVDEEQDKIIEQASAVKDAKEAEIKALQDSSEYRNAKNTVDELSQKDYQKYVEASQKKAGDYKSGILFWKEYYTQEEIDAAKARVAAYDAAKALINDADKKIADLQNEADTEQAKINNAEAAKQQAANAVTDASKKSSEATNSLNAVKAYIYSEESIDLELTKEQQEKYQRLLQEAQESAGAFEEVAGDTIDYIAATDRSIGEYITGLLNGKTFKDLSTELNLEGKYYASWRDPSTGMLYVLKSDKDNSKYLIALGNDRCRISKIDEMEANVYAASYDAAVSAAAASEAAKAAEREKKALEEYQKALEEYNTAQAALNSLKLEKEISAQDIAKAEEAVKAAKQNVEQSKADYADIQAASELADNYAKWTRALATEQKSDTYFQLDENNEYAKQNIRDFDISDATVSSQEQKYFSGNKGSVTVPYDVFRNYVKAMVQKNYSADKVMSDAQGMGEGIALTGQDAEKVYFWEMDENGNVTGEPILGMSSLQAGKRYFVAYAFKRESGQAYHLDGYIVEVPEKVLPEPTTEPTTEPATGSSDNSDEQQIVTIEDTPTALAATPVNTDQAVLGARRTSGNSTGDAAVLGAKRGVDQAVLGKRRNPETGDSAAMPVWVIVFGLSLAGAAIAGMKCRKAFGKE